MGLKHVWNLEHTLTDRHKLLVFVNTFWGGHRKLCTLCRTSEFTICILRKLYYTRRTEVLREYQLTCYAWEDEKPVLSISVKSEYIDFQRGWKIERSIIWKWFLKVWGHVPVTKTIELKWRPLVKAAINNGFGQKDGGNSNVQGDNYVLKDFIILKY
jgi:hypothetical protein